MTHPDDDKTQRYDKLYQYLLVHDSDFAFQHAVMGDVWMRAQFTTAHLFDSVDRIYSRRQKHGTFDVAS